MSARKIWSLLKETVEEWQRDQVDRMAAALAYYTLFSIAPLMVRIDRLAIDSSSGSSDRLI